MRSTDGIRFPLLLSPDQTVNEQPAQGLELHLERPDATVLNLTACRIIMDSGLPVSSVEAESGWVRAALLSIHLSLMRKLSCSLKYLLHWNFNSWVIHFVSCWFISFHSTLKDGVSLQWRFCVWDWQSVGVKPVQITQCLQTLSLSRIALSSALLIVLLREDLEL